MLPERTICGIVAQIFTRIDEIWGNDQTDRILGMAAEMAGGEDRAAIWFKHRPLPGWAGKTAYDLVRKGKADKVLAQLEATRAGVYA